MLPGQKPFHTEPLIIGGNEAFCSLPEDYDGKCKVISLDSHESKAISITPDPSVARAIATYAVSPDGGHGCVDILPAPDEVPTHLELVDFIML